MPYVIKQVPGACHDECAHPDLDHRTSAEPCRTATGEEIRDDEHAVAELEQARWRAGELLAAANSVAEGGPRSTAFTPSERADVDDAIGEAGGTVAAPLDGTTIHVERVSWAELNRRAGKPESTVAMVAQAGESNGWPAAHVAFARTAILDTFNGRGH